MVKPHCALGLSISYDRNLLPESASEPHRNSNWPNPVDHNRHNSSLNTANTTPTVVDSSNRLSHRGLLLAPCDCT